MTSYEIIAVLRGTHTSSPHTRLQFVPAHGYTAVLAHHPHVAIKLPLSRKDVLRSAAQRQAWLEHCMPFATVLPFRPQATIDKVDVPALIAANRPLFDGLTNRLVGKVQFQVTVSWDPNGVLNRFRDTPELSDLFVAKSIAPARLTQSIERLAKRLRDQINQTLEDVADEILQLPVTADMLTNTVVLMHIDRLSYLDQSVEAIDAIWTEGLRIKQIGPAPAASFASIDLHRIDASDVTIAMQTLGSKPLDTPEAIMQARRDALLRSPSAAADIKRSAEILNAAMRGGADNQSLFLCSVISDDAAATVADRKVA